LIFGSRVSEEEKVEFEKPANLISAMRRLCCQNGVSSCHRSNASPSQNGKSSSTLVTNASYVEMISNLNCFKSNTMF
jgi:hypothetical protein